MILVGVDDLLRLDVDHVLREIKDGIVRGKAFGLHVRLRQFRSLPAVDAVKLLAFEKYGADALETEVVTA